MMVVEADVHPSRRARSSHGIIVANGNGQRRIADMVECDRWTLRKNFGTELCATSTWAALTASWARGDTGADH